MIVRPDAISASSAPSTSPLKHCEIKFAQLTTPPHLCNGPPGLLRGSPPRRRRAGYKPTPRGFGPRGDCHASGIVARLAAEGVRRLDDRVARDHFEHFPEVLVVLHFGLGLALDDDDRAHALMVFGAIMDIAE